MAVKGQRGAGQGCVRCLWMFAAISTDSTEGTADIVIAELVERIGAQTVIAGVIGDTVLTVDDQIEVKVRKLMLTILEHFRVMLDGFRCNLLESNVLVAATTNRGKIEGASVTLEIPVRC